MRTVLTFFALLLTSGLFAQDDLDNFINRLKKSEATGGSETAFMSAGAEFMYGQHYFEKNTYDMAAMYFRRAQQMDSTNPYFNYQFAIALLKQADAHKAPEGVLIEGAGAGIGLAPAAAGEDQLGPRGGEVPAPAGGAGARRCNG